jgi:16S rRNA processing protein RimM
MPDTPVALAAIAGAHGVTGEVRLKLFGDGAESLRRHEAFNGGALTLASLREDGKGGAIARFREVSDRTGAEALRGTVLAVSRSALPPLEEGEFYYADLVGLPVWSESGKEIGKVVEIADYGATEIAEIELAGGGRFMVPLTDQAVPRWDRERLVVAESFLP